MATWLRLALVTMTVGGGYLGVAIALQALANPGALQAQQLWIVAGFGALYAFVLVAGLLFVQNPRRILPVVIAVTAQVPWVSSPLVTYRFTAGAHAAVGMIAGRFAASARLGSDFQFHLLQPMPIGCGVNLVAVLFLALLLRSQSRPAMPPTPPPPTPPPLPGRPAW